MLFLDESGTHGGSSAFIVSGVAVQEDDAHSLQGKLDSFLQRKLSTPPLSLNAQKFELHATDIKSHSGEWNLVPPKTRWEILHGTFDTIARFKPNWDPFPMALFGAVVDRQKIPNRKEREKYAYELVLNKFDAFLRFINRTPARQSGLVIHDQRVIHGGKRVWTDERAIQEWTRDWREAAGRVGRLHHLADVPVFADSQASRLIQAADFISWALNRYYLRNDDVWLSKILANFHADSEIMHGLIHVSRDYATGTCTCPPCKNRLDRGLDATA